MRGRERERLVVVHTCNYGSNYVLDMMNGLKLIELLERLLVQEGDTLVEDHIARYR